MARASFAVSIGSTTIGAENFGSVAPVADPVAASGYAAAKTAFEAALAVLVADGALPTQAHVTTADAAYTTFAAALGGAPGATSDFVVSMDLAKVGSRSVLRRLLNVFAAAMESRSGLTA